MFTDCCCRCCRFAAAVAVSPYAAAVADVVSLLVPLLLCHRFAAAVAVAVLLSVPLLLLPFCCRCRCCRFVAADAVSPFAAAAMTLIVAVDVAVSLLLLPFRCRSHCRCFRFAAVPTVAVAISLPLSLSLLLIRCQCCRFAAADRFFAVSPSNTKRMGVSPS